MKRIKEGIADAVDGGLLRVNGIKNKRGGDKVISVYWFAILVIVAGGVVLMVNAFYNSPYDVREVEGEILAAKVADCIYSGGKFNFALISGGVFKDEFHDNFMSRCNLDFIPRGEFERVEYYLSVEFWERGEKSHVFFPIEEGNLNLKVDCNIKAEKKKLSTCVEREFWAFESENKPYLVKIKAVINKVEGNV